MNRNVVLFALYSLLTGAGNAICFFVLLSPLLFLLTGDPLFVGYAEGVQGLCSALVAIPAGLLADKWSRAGVARVGLSLSLLVYAAMATVVWLPLASMPLYWIMFALLALEGLGFGAQQAVVSFCDTHLTAAAARCLDGATSRADERLDAHGRAKQVANCRERVLHAGQPWRTVVGHGADCTVRTR